VYRQGRLRKHDGKSDLLFVNRAGRPFSANKLREKQLHPLLVKLGMKGLYEAYQVLRMHAN